MDAEEVASAPEEGAFVLKANSDGTHTLVNALAGKRGLKTELLSDDQISWEQFFEAMPRIIDYMKQYNWPKDHVDMHYTFWLNLHSHPWRTSTDRFAKQALLTYQARYRWRWHLTIGTNAGFSLAKINQAALDRIHTELSQGAFSTQIGRLNSVSLFLALLFYPPAVTCACTFLLRPSHATPPFLLP